ncbi:unnamed protein product [Rotaria socialis]|uniref:Uncharacterized protein n=1 Tax=Rotaria socialis TaxID=392032 RepID=A0A817UMV7_9BILA|nr:unnamed protein product [Rotaria socialis]CAF3328971.1 unnamed protein product [Rotaria socialis]CAF3444449.1 unnamed protein product [Rotaria socialis]CAF4351164.1 unnamed protein product [Rotaria socialis]CAF4514539.1 unnamed protein product [Rotaria socialis]
MIAFISSGTIWPSIHGMASVNCKANIMSNDSTKFHNYYYKNNSLQYQSLCDRYSEGVNIHNYQKLKDHECETIANACRIPSCSAAIDIVVLWVNIDDGDLKNLFHSIISSPELVLDSRHNQISENRVHDFKQQNRLLRPSKQYFSMMRSPLRDSISSNRFRDLKQLKYFLRSVEENGREWARRIFLITNNQVPDYLNINHLRIRIVNHQQLFKYTNVTPPKHPLFNSMAIQSMVHNIPTLSSPFYLFDDDILIRKYLLVTTIIDGNKSIVDLNNNPFNILSKPLPLFHNHVHTAINMVKRIKSIGLLGSNGLHYIAVHGPLLLYREIGIKIWNEFREEMKLTISHPFRMPTDPSIQTLYIYMGYSDYYTFLKTRNILKFEMLTNSQPEKIRNTLRNAFADKTVYFVCVNDDFQLLTKQMQQCVNEAYDSIFPKCSSFEY